MRWTIFTVISAIMALDVALIVIDHKSLKIDGYKRLFWCFGYERLVMHYLTQRHSITSLSSIGTSIDNRCRCERLKDPWLIRMRFPAKKGELMIDLPLKESDDGPISEPLLLNKKGKVGMGERQKIIDELTMRLRND